MLGAVSAPVKLIQSALAHGTDPSETSMHAAITERPSIIVCRNCRGRGGEGRTNTRPRRPIEFPPAAGNRDGCATRSSPPSSLSAGLLLRRRFPIRIQVDDDRAFFSRDDAGSGRGIPGSLELQVLAIGAADRKEGYCKDDDPMIHVPILRLARRRQNFCRTPIVPATTSW